ncbi:MAG: aminopeptidase [Candidatus Infernicultor aquiphilus]|uniref:Probable cytosol aminopeptidase n=1 Tax=Candidatus Infernicultor aquiphilus TaxID=1805029 RepID=A0A2M7K805_9BACT|nr:MAG: aminopeptidase [Candidatus Atribacteria bacterium CG_4_8_14_3_um_filter_34_18]
MEFFNTPSSFKGQLDVRGFMLFENSDLPEEVAPYSHLAAQWRKKGFLQFIPCAEGSVRWLAVIGLGQKPEKRLAQSTLYRNMTAEFVRKGTTMNLSSFALILPEEPDDLMSRAVAEGAVLGNYRFTKYRTTNSFPVAQCEHFCLDRGDLAAITQGKHVAEAQIYARNLANEPGNVISPLTMATIARDIATRHEMEITILDEHEIQEKGLLALWHVGKGSKTPPRLVHMVYKPKGTPLGKIALVGKSVTFDSGGLCIKTREGIKTMKGDKSGACNVLGIMNALPELQCPYEVHGLFGAVENMPDGNAYRPDDIIKAMNGKTIEIKNTDAEGRVTLADMLAYTSTLKPDAIIDIATLTGAAVTALGNYTAGLVSDWDDLIRELLEAADKAGERFHRFIMDDEKLREQINTPNADVANSGGPGGGVITAGMFLREFVDPLIPWAHMDIAAVDYYDKEFDCYGIGASAFSLRTCLEYLMKPIFK